MTGSPTDDLASAERRIQELMKELSDAREQQAVTAEILRVISSSPTDLQSVFAGIAASAARLCDGYNAGIFRLDGEHLRLVAHHGPVSAVGPVGDGTLPLTRGLPPARAVLDRQILHVADLQTETTEYPEGSDFARRLGFRAALAVPLMRADEPIGVITIRRTDARPFTDQQVDLLKSFAGQAVIAIENTRLFEAEQASKRELQESLEYQTATDEVLSAISKSPHALQPVLDTIIETAARLCQADYARFRLLRDGAYHVVARLSHDPDPPERHIPLRPGHESIVGRVALERTTIHIPDVRADPAGGAYALNRRLAARTVLGVPLLKQGNVVGIIVLFRDIPQAFSERQIGMLETFANQATIAIENTRLFEAEQASKRELQESLEYQTAISEVLSIISRSPSELQPVMDAIASTAKDLCNAYDAALLQRSGDHLSVVSHRGPLLLAGGRPMDRSTVTGRALLDKRTIHVHDYLEVAEQFPLGAELALKHGGRTALAIPLVLKTEAIGCLFIRRIEVRPFSNREIELLKTFADQAVIAIENTRLFEAEQAGKRELQRSLEYQTAISNVLSVISQSPNDLQPVLDAIAETAMRLCPSDRAAIRLKSNGFRPSVIVGDMPDRITEEYKDWAPILDRRSVTGRVVLDRRTVHVHDVWNDPASIAVPASAREGRRTVLGVPLKKEGEILGMIVLVRGVVRPFADREIKLVETFADQAVIAIENTRLFEAEQASKRELQESLEYQTATGEVLSVISRSPTELQPVLRSIATTAARLCDSIDAQVYRVIDGKLKMVSQHGSLPRLEARYQLPLTRGSVTGQAILERRTVHVDDISALLETEYPDAKPSQLVVGHRTTLATPMLREGEPIGAILLRRNEVRPFTSKQITLLQTFADQAVIAIENTRLFEAEQASKRELTEALEQQTATADVLKVISRSALDVQKVLDALVESASRLCDANDAAILQVFGNSLRLVADQVQSFPTANSVGFTSLPLVRGTIAGRAIIERRTIQVADVLAEADEYPESQKLALKVGYRTVLCVPLVRAGEAIGVIIVRRTEVRPFTERQIELVNTFADQAVIAIENSRLFEEVQARTRELAKTVEDLEIASQHKNQFVANMSHELRTPLAAILGYAELIQEGFYEPQGPKSLDALTRICSNGKHLLGLINTVLDIAKIESGQFTLNMSEYAIESVVETVRAATESLAQNKKLTLTTFVDKSLPVGLGDEQRLTQVLLNLVGNAIKFTDAGGVSIAAGARDGRFAVSVTDTGPGIPLDQQDRIFDQFHQVDSSNTKAKGGTGLGLAIAKQIVEMHGGRIWVESLLGKGAIFQMELPIRAAFRKSAP